MKARLFRSGCIARNSRRPGRFTIPRLASPCPFNFAHKPGNGERPPITAGERIDAIGTMSSRAIIEASETTANDIQQAGEAAVENAAELLKEAQELAARPRETGKKMGEHHQEFATLARKG
jgi:hypothetical protein